MITHGHIFMNGHKVTVPGYLVTRLEESSIEFNPASPFTDEMHPMRISAEQAAANAAVKAKAEAEAAKQVTPQKDECTFEDFEKMDIRTATVLEAERVPKTDKLLKLTIDTGIDKRVIVSGIAEHYSPEEMVGKQICILANLAPRKIRGIESKGMILMARQNDGKMRFVTPAEALCNGAEIG